MKYNSIYMKCTEKTNLQRQKAEQWYEPGMGRDGEMGE